MNKRYLFPKASKSLSVNEKSFKLKLQCTYLDGRGEKIRIYNRIAWDGIIFYVGKYIDIPNDDIKNAECKFFESGNHFLYWENEYHLIEEISEEKYEEDN